MNDDYKKGAVEAVAAVVGLVAASVAVVPAAGIPARLASPIDGSKVAARIAGGRCSSTALLNQSNSPRRSTPVSPTTTNT